LKINKGGRDALNNCGADENRDYTSRLQALLESPAKYSGDWLKKLRLLELEFIDPRLAENQRRLYENWRQIPLTQRNRMRQEIREALNVNTRTDYLFKQSMERRLQILETFFGIEPDDDVSARSPVPFGTYFTKTGKRKGRKCDA
jgi:hypothetical protein